MKIHVSKLHQVARDYLVQVIIPKIPNDAMQFLTASGTYFVNANLVAHLLAPYLPVLQVMGVIKDDMIDLDEVKQAALMAMEQCHGSFMILGYGADAQDIEQLYNIATRYCEPEGVPQAQPTQPASTTAATATSEIKAI